MFRIVTEGDKTYISVEMSIMEKVMKLAYLGLAVRKAYKNSVPDMSIESVLKDVEEEVCNVKHQKSSGAV